MDIFNMLFKDAVSFDQKTKTCISIRDGVQKYKGYELGFSPPDKIFTVYRAPKTVKAIIDKLGGLPLTDGHVSLDITPSNPVGKILDAQLIDAKDEETKSTINIKNKVSLDFDVSDRQLSLGYRGGLIDCDIYDFEQVDIVPHHLAIVQKGRCGKACKFTDKENKNMKKKTELKIAAKAFLDAADGDVTMAQVMDIVTALPEAIKTMSLKDLNKLVPMLQKVTASVEGVAEEAEEEAMTPEEKAAAEEQKATVDANALKTEEEQKKLTDKAFKDSIDTEVKKRTAEYSSVVIKAQGILPDTYDFTDKSTDDVMRAAVATQHASKFTDSELPTAFKMLKPVKMYKDFGDKKETTSAAIDEIGEKEL